MIEWVWPWAFVLLPVPWLVRRLAPAARRDQAALAVPDVGAFRLPDPSVTGAGGGRVPWRLVLLIVAWAALVTATARPQWTGEPVRLPTSGRDLMLAVDISGSMGTEDMQLGDTLVDRLVVVKRVVSEFIEAREGDRVGLILFGTNAYLQAPLTFDLATVKTLLTEAPIGIAGGKTAVGDAIGLAIKRLRDRPEDHRVVVLLTDGANNVGEVAPIKAAELAAAANVKIYTVGVGAAELRMPGIFGSFGSRIINPSAELDEETLQEIAQLTGGRYFRAQNTAELIEIYALIDELEPIEQDPETFRPIAALFYWPLAAAWIAMLLLVVLDYGRSRPLAVAR